MFPVLCASALHNVGSDLILNFVVEYFPNPAERGPWKGTLNGEEVERRGEGFGARLRVRLQDRRRSVRRAVSPTSKWSPASSRTTRNLVNARTSGAERLSHIGALFGKTIPPVTELHAGDIGGVAKLKDTLTGDTLDDKASLIAYPGGASARAVHRLRHLRQDAQRRRPHGQRDSQDSRRRPLAALLSRSADQGISAGRQRPAARRNHRQPPEEALRRRRRTARAEDSLSRNHPRQGRRAGPPQEADRRPRPVRRLLDSHGAAAARREIRIRQRSLRRRDSRKTSFPAIEKGIVETAEKGYLAGFPGGRFQGDRLRRLLSRRRFLGNVVQAGGAQGVQGRRWKRPSRRCWSR